MQNKHFRAFISSAFDLYSFDLWSLFRLDGHSSKNLIKALMRQRNNLKYSPFTWLFPSYIVDSYCLRGSHCFSQITFAFFPKELFFENEYMPTSVK